MVEPTYELMKRVEASAPHRRKERLESVRKVVSLNRPKLPQPRIPFSAFKELFGENPTKT